MGERRSDCPIAQALDIVGDRWSLLVVRDIAMYGKHTFTEIEASAEGIAPSTLADRLKRLTSHEIISREKIRGGPGRQYRYSLTKSGIDLLPILIDMLQWSASHDPQTKVPSAYRKRLTRDRDKIIAELGEKARA